MYTFERGLYIFDVAHFWTFCKQRGTYLSMKHADYSFLICTATPPRLAVRLLLLAGVSFSVLPALVNHPLRILQPAIPPPLSRFTSSSCEGVVLTALEMVAEFEAASH